MRDIKDLNIDELELTFKEWGVAAFRTRQVFDWVYKKGVSDFMQMSNLPLDLRKRLKENFCLLSFRIIDKLRSQDGTEKLLFELSDKNVIEAVNIPAQNRVTACLSTQVGCRFSCGFCASGLLGFKRNLSCGEMLEELCYLKNNSKDKKVTHVVFMGTGEPFDNYSNVLKAIRAINAEWGFNIGSRRITVSTNGIIPGIEKLSREGLQVELSVSLHAADEKTRSYLMPVNKIYSLSDLIKACRKYAEATGRQVTFEYMLIEGLNSDLSSAAKLGKILWGFDCKVNLIIYNTVEELGLKAPARPEIISFKERLEKSGIHATLRRSRGQDIAAACGQLRLSYVKK